MQRFVTRMLEATRALEKRSEAVARAADPVFHPGSVANMFKRSFSLKVRRDGRQVISSAEAVAHARRPSVCRPSCRSAARRTPPSSGSPWTWTSARPTCCAALNSAMRASSVCP